MRGAIDALAARLAAQRIKNDPAGRAHLEAALHAGRASDQTTSLARLITLDVDFHSAIYRLAGNPAIEEMIAPQWPHMRRSMATVLAELDYRAERLGRTRNHRRAYPVGQRQGRGRLPRWRMRSARDE